MNKIINILVVASLLGNTGMVALAHNGVDDGDGEVSAIAQIKNYNSSKSNTAVTEVQEARKEAVTEKREAVKNAVTERKDAVKAAQTEFKTNLEKEREAFKQKIDAAKTEFKTKRDAQKEELKTRLAKIKDERKKKAVERLDNRFNEINQKLVNHWVDVLDRLVNHLKKISERADALATGGKDVAAVRTAAQKAETAIAAARTALEAQSKKTYTLNVADEATLKSVVSAVRESLNKDLAVVKELVRTAHKAVVDALHALNQARGEKEPKATTTQQSQ